MEIQTSGKPIKVDKRTIRIVFTTHDLARLVGVSDEYFRQLIRKGDIVFTGNPFIDYDALVSYKKERS